MAAVLSEEGRPRMPRDAQPRRQHSWTLDTGEERTRWHKTENGREELKVISERSVTKKSI